MVRMFLNPLFRVVRTWAAMALLRWAARFVSGSTAGAAMMRLLPHAANAHYLLT